MFKKLCVLMFILAASAGMCYAAIPQMIGYEGRLTDSSGNPVTTSRSFTFRIYSQASGGSPVTNGTSTESITPDSNGIFSAAIGFQSSVFDGTNRWLGVEIASDGEMTPRIQIASAAHAYRALQADDSTKAAGYTIAASGANVIPTTDGTGKLASAVFPASVTGISSVGAAALTGAVSLKGGTNVTLLQSGQTIEFSAAGGGGSGTVTQVNTSRGLLGGPITTTGILTIDTNVVVTTTDAQTLTNKTIDGSLNTITNITAASTNYAILAGTATTAATVSNGAITASKMATGSVTSDALASDSIIEPKLNATNSPTNGQVLSYGGSNQFTWVTSGGTGTVTQVNSSRGLLGGPITTTGTLTIDTNVVVTTTDAQTLTNKTIDGGSNLLTNLDATNITSGTIEDARLSSAVVTTSDAQTLTSKTIDGSLNTITNITAANTNYAVLAGTASTAATVNDGAITASKMGTGSVTSDAILNGTIIGADLATNININTAGLITAEAFTGAFNGTFTGTAEDSYKLGGNLPSYFATASSVASKADLATLNTHTGEVIAHGTTGRIVGTSDAQALTNKTIDGSLNTITNITATNANYAALSGTSTVATTAVLKAGDIMTGTLTLPASGLIVGASQLVVKAGNVGIGTSNPQGVLDVHGDNNGVSGETIQLNAGNGPAGGGAGGNVIINGGTNMSPGANGGTITLTGGSVSGLGGGVVLTAGGGAAGGGSLSFVAASGGGVGGGFSFAGGNGGGGAGGGAIFTTGNGTGPSGTRGGDYRITLGSGSAAADAGVFSVMGGNVGIGTMTPEAGYKLSIVGNVKIGSASIESSTGKYYGDGSGLTGVTATNANYATLSGTATIAASADFAALSGTSSTCSGNAATANYTVLAGTVSTAAAADYAMLAGTATVAASADFATLAGTASTAAYTTLSGTATNAGYATLAGIATTAASANYATLAGTASTAVTVNDGAITSSKMSTGSVTSDAIANDTIVNADINSAAAIDYSKLNLANSITGSDIATNTVITAAAFSGSINASVINGATSINTTGVATFGAAGTGLYVSDTSAIGGSLVIGATTFDATNPEHLKVDAGTSSSVNVISGYGNLNNYIQLNIKNRNAGGNASSDLVATADNGDETVNYVDLGMNSSGYNNASYTITGANDAYLYNMGQNFSIGTGTSGKVLKFHTGGTLAANERMRIDGSGRVGIGTTNPTGKLHVVGGNDGVTGEAIKLTAGAGPAGSGAGGSVILTGGANTSPGAGGGTITVSGGTTGGVGGGITMATGGGSGGNGSFSFSGASGVGVGGGFTFTGGLGANGGGGGITFTTGVGAGNPGTRGGDFRINLGNGATIPTDNGRFSVMNGSVGLGTMTPEAGYELSVVGNVKIGSASIESSTGKYYGDGSGLTGVTATNANYAILSGTSTVATTAVLKAGDIMTGTLTNSAGATFGDKVGIGTSTPEASLHVTGGALLLSGTTGATPVSGAGTRMMWIPAKGAFRAGKVSGTQWDDANIGTSSIAMGESAKASGLYSVAFGIGSQATGIQTISLGAGASAIGLCSAALGFVARASGSGSTAIGYETEATGEGSVAIGYANDEATARVVADGPLSIAIGTSNYADGSGGVFSSGNGSTAIGSVNSAATDASIKALGTGSFAAGYALDGAIESSGTGSVAIGYGSSGGALKASGTGSVAIGQNVSALTNPNVLAFGKDFSASTQESFNIGFGQLDYQFTSTEADFHDSSITTTGKYYGDGSELTGITATNAATANYAVLAGTASNTANADYSALSGTSSACSGSASDNVLKAGDTMTGTLTLPASGLRVGTNQLVVSGGNVGIGTTSPQGKLHVLGGNNGTSGDHIQLTAGAGPAGSGAGGNIVLTAGNNTTPGSSGGAITVSGGTAGGAGGGIAMTAGAGANGSGSFSFTSSASGGLGGGFSFTASNGGGASGGGMTFITGNGTGGPGTKGGDFRISLGTGGSAADNGKFSIMSGSVGLGTMTPEAGYELSVVGNVKVGSASIESTTGKYFGNGSGLTGVTATTANYATLAGTATTAASADFATLSGTSSACSGNADTANYAVLAETATSASYADLSGTSSYTAYATLAGSATTAAFANYAILAGTATTAASADFAALSGTASYAALSGNATTAANVSNTINISTSGYITAETFNGGDVIIPSGKNVYLSDSSTSGNGTITIPMIAASAIAAGDVVVYDPSADNQVKTTTTTAEQTVMGFATNTTSAPGQTIYVAVTGRVTNAKANGTILRGNPVETDITPGYIHAVPGALTVGASVGIALTNDSGGTVTVWIHKF